VTLYLALDTATDRPTLALGTPADPGADLALPGRRELSRDIGRLAAELLAGRGMRAANLAGVVVADGPGSFTGLRIGVAFAKGLCRAAGLPLLALPSLLGAARAAAPDGTPVLVTYDALRGDVFGAAYRFDVLDSVADVSELDAVVFHSGRASARTRSRSAGCRLGSVRTSTLQPRSSSRS